MALPQQRDFMLIVVTSFHRISLLLIQAEVFVCGSGRTEQPVLRPGEPTSSRRCVLLCRPVRRTPINYIYITVYFVAVKHAWRLVPQTACDQLDNLRPSSSSQPASRAFPHSIACFCCYPSPRLQCHPTILQLVCQPLDILTMQRVSTASRASHQNV